MEDDAEQHARIALLAHDLRTPLAAMRLTAELIGHGGLNDSQSQQLGILIKSIDALADMTGELLDGLPKGAEGEQKLSSVGDLVSESCALFRNAAEAKGLHLTHSIHQDMFSRPIAQGATVRRLVTTLLDNAVKYTPSGGIDVSLTQVPSDAESAGEWISICVRDTGPGINPEEKARLFKPYARGRHGRETAPGSGLGLWGCAQFVKELGGQFLLTAPQEGGSCFEVRLPMSVIADGTVSQDVPSSELHSEPALLPTRVLIVDDNETNCRLLEALLDSYGVASDSACSGPEAIELAKTKHYDAALVDLHMPGMNGVETAVELGALERKTPMPVIAVTAAVESLTEENIARGGFLNVLAKPLSPDILFDAMQEAQKTLMHSQENHNKGS